MFAVMAEPLLTTMGLNRIMQQGVFVPVSGVKPHIMLLKNIRHCTFVLVICTSLSDKYSQFLLFCF